MLVIDREPIFHEFYVGMEELLLLQGVSQKVDVTSCAMFPKEYIITCPEN